MTIERKSVSQSFKDVDVKAGIVTGYLSCFGNVDSDGDVIQKGSFTKTIIERGPQSPKPRIKHLMDHYISVGTFQVLREDDYGLYYESKAGQYPDGRNFLLYVEDGVITEHSIGFNITQSKQENNYNLITEMKLWEGSSLRLWGANPETPITGLKSYEDIVSTFSKLGKCLKSGKYTDDEMLVIEANYKKLSEYFKTTQPSVIASETTVPSEGKEENQKFSEILKQARGAWQLKQNC